jgi:hypothetical protein
VPSPIMPGWTTSDFFLVSAGIVELFVISNLRAGA